MRNARRQALLGTPVLAVALVLAGCSGSEDPDAPGGAPTSEGSASASADASASAPETSSAAPTLPVPEGVELTTQGSALELGDDAVVAYRPNQNDVGVLRISVTDLRRTTFEKSFRGWKLDKSVRKATPYFVEATFENLGESDLGGKRPPLYIVDGTDTLVESSTFVSDFEPCPSTDFPKRFEPGDKVKRCLVYLAPDGGELVAVSFRPTQEDAPITWSGEVLRLGRASGSAEDGGKKGRDQGGERGGKRDRQGRR